MIEIGRETTMEKLELLSRTALLKQGIDRSSNSAGNTVVPHSRYLLSVAAVSTDTDGMPSIRIGDRRNDTTSSSTVSSNRTNAVGSSPVSTDVEDVEDEDDAVVITTTPSIASSKTRHNLHSTKARIIESRSPITTVEYGQYVAAPPSSPFPSSPQSYGFGLLPSHTNILHQNHSQDQQDYTPSQFINHTGNIIRTLSEASFAPYGPSSLMPLNSHSAAAAAANNNESDVAFRPPQREVQPPRLQLQQRRQSSPSREDMARQISELREQLSDKDMIASSLQHRVNYLENQIHELRQLPTGKISHIPVIDMIRIMQAYGSEVSNQTLPQQRKQSIKKASIVRQFRRWNPNFFQFFLHHNGEWVPKLGKEGELRRRAEKRRLLLITKQSAGIKSSETK